MIDHLEVHKSCVITETLPSGNTISGITLRMDYKYEEEAGIVDMSELFTLLSDKNSVMAQEAVKDGKALKQNKSQKDMLIDDIDGYLVIINGNHRVYIDEVNDQINRMKRHDENTKYNARRYEFEYETVNNLRKIAKEKGITPIPSKKDDLVEALLINSGLSDDNTYAFRFPYGQYLILPEGTDDEYGRIIAKIKDAALSGHLAIGGVGSVSVFHRGLTLFDSRDFNEEDIKNIQDYNEWHRTQMKKVEFAKEAMEGRGHRYYFLGNPRQDDDGEVYYWLNSHVIDLGNGTSKQVYGWFTLQELLSGDYVKKALKDK